MKQAAAIFLMGVFSFNLFGYRLVADYLAHKADINLAVTLDTGGYDESQLITIKEPVKLPYYNNSKTFQPAEGEVKKNGILYRYVKCRIYNDSLEMLCIPHTAKMQIQHSKEAFFKGSNDLQQENSKKKNPHEQKQGKNTVSEYELIQRPVFATRKIISNVFFNNTQAVLPIIFASTAERPPDSFSRTSCIF